jgi:hypothetical protein
MPKSNISHESLLRYSSLFVATHVKSVPGAMYSPNRSPVQYRPTNYAQHQEQEWRGRGTGPEEGLEGISESTKSAGRDWASWAAVRGAEWPISCSVVKEEPRPAV